MQGAGVEQRHVGGGDEHRAAEFAAFGQLGHRALHGASGAGDVILVDDFDLVVVGAGGGGHTVGLVVHDDGERVRILRVNGCHHALKEGFAGEGVQHLRGARTHACALARGEDDGGG